MMMRDNDHWCHETPCFLIGLMTVLRILHIIALSITLVVMSIVAYNAFGARSGDGFVALGWVMGVLMCLYGVIMRGPVTGTTAAFRIFNRYWSMVFIVGASWLMSYAYYWDYARHTYFTFWNEYKGDDGRIQERLWNAYKEAEWMMIDNVYLFIGVFVGTAMLPLVYVSVTERRST